MTGLVRLDNVTETARVFVGVAMESDEPSLLARAREGDRTATEVLVRRHLRDVYEVALRVLGDRDAAEDAAQDTFVNVLRALPRFRGESSFRTWLIRIALNTARSWGRKKSRRRESPLALVEEVASDEADVATRTIQHNEAERIERALIRLPEKQRLAVTLRLQGLSYAEVGALCGSSEGAARVNYHLGIKRLREIMS